VDQEVNSFEPCRALRDGLPLYLAELPRRGSVQGFLAPALNSFHDDLTTRAHKLLWSAAVRSRRDSVRGWVTRIGKWLRLVALIFSFALLLVLVTGIYSVAPGNLDVAVTPDVQADPNVQGGILRLRVPVTIVNHGFYDIRDIVVRVDAMNSSQALVFQATSDPFAIAAGVVFNQDVVVAVNLTEAFMLHGSYYLFHSENLSLNVVVSCRYLLNLFGVVLEIPNLTMPWAAPLQDFAVNVTQVGLAPYGAGSAVNATLVVTHNGWLQLNQTAVHSELYHLNGTLIASNLTAVDLVPGVTPHQVLLPLTDAWYLYLNSTNATLRVTCMTRPLGITINQSQLVGWIAPPAGPTSPPQLSKSLTVLGFSTEWRTSSYSAGTSRQRSCVFKRLREAPWLDSSRCQGGDL
jgi:hypothetical protein